MSDDIFERIADLAPALRQALYDEKSRNAPDMLRFSEAGALADALASNVDRLTNDTLSAIFGLFEQAMVDGEADAKIVATGLLEALQHADSRGAFDFRTIAPLLGPLSAAHCRALDRFHGAVTRGL